MRQSKVAIYQRFSIFGTCRGPRFNGSSGLSEFSLNLIVTPSGNVVMVIRLRSPNVPLALVFLFLEEKLSGRQ